MITFYKIIQDDGQLSYCFSDSEDFSVLDGTQITMKEYLIQNKFPVEIGRDATISMAEFEDLLNNYIFTPPKSGQQEIERQVNE